MKLTTTTTKTTTHAQTELKERGILQYFGLKALNNMLILNLFEFKIERSIMFL